ncbi:hypothetical protein J1N35_000139 [Gossypium stocksii]|uniref:HhH-GPD domain-containing protein n=1 Tax=Gossypium stocksii TaxID=47602 RepID=A0A9D4AK78_9ROSI|nr:hypothetical protein J1N35_000139 [Gossypium stocksii]
MGVVRQVLHGESSLQSWFPHDVPQRLDPFAVHFDSQTLLAPFPLPSHTLSTTLSSLYKSITPPSPLPMKLLFWYEQVGRMLRISNKDERDVMEYQEMHSWARENGLGRIFRSPSFFEDAVKSILLCNCRFSHRALSLLQPKIALDGNARLKRKRSKCSDDIGNFPSWKELLAWSWVHDKYLIKQCNVGYRAARILQRATMCAQGDLREDHIPKLEQSSNPTSFETLYQKLLKIKGFGPFVCSNIMVHGKQNCSKETIGKDDGEIYGKYYPFKCLAYWVELIEEYENKFGKLSKLEATNSHLIAATRYLGTRE